MSPTDPDQPVDAPPSPAAPPSFESTSADIGALRVLVVDDEPILRGVIAQVLEMDGHDVVQAACAEDALELFRETPFSFVMTDVIMGKMSGLDLLREIRKLDSSAIVAIMTSQASLENATAALRDGAYDFLVKPFDDLIIVSALARRARDRLELRARNRLLVEQLKSYTSELERVNTKLKEMADRDGLTELHNHRYFRRALDGALVRASQNATELSLLLIDVDHFKGYNDTHGHLAGDELLKELSRVLAESAGEGETSARYGGEEFALILPGVDHETALSRATALTQRVAKQTVSEESSARERVTISIGVASFPDGGRDDKSLIDSADECLYRAKQAGRNQANG